MPYGRRQQPLRRSLLRQQLLLFDTLLMPWMLVSAVMLTRPLTQLEHLQGVRWSLLFLRPLRVSGLCYSGLRGDYLAALSSFFFKVSNGRDD